MKRTVSVFMVLALAVSLLACLTGCKNAEVSVQSVGLVSTIRKNFTYLSFDKKSRIYSENKAVCGDIYDSISEALYSYGSVVAVTAEGNPAVCGEAEFHKPDALIDSSKRKQLSDKEADRFFKELDEDRVAKTAETNVLQAIAIVADALNGSDAESKTIYIVDSGLSTTGYVNFVKSNLFYVDTALFIEKLREKHAIPNLNGINVVWYGLGNVCGDQVALPSEQAFRLKEIWSAILTESGAEKTYFKTTPLRSVTYDYDSKLPTVSEVPVSDIDIGMNNSYMTIDIESLGFEPDTARILNKAVAEQCLLDVIGSLEKDPSLNIIIAGSCATVGSGKTLSKERADAVKAMLCARGIKESRITTVGLGSTECSLRVDDLNPDGTLNEALAKRNRAVFIFRADSQIAEEIIALTRGAK